MGAKAFVEQGALAVPGFPVANLVAHLVTVITGTLVELMACLVDTVFHVAGPGRKILSCSGGFIRSVLGVHQICEGRNN